ncbi:hypothetical protein Ct9H90mP29_05660 [bacterium]|nr:MAG: hypothetical protein Ct9H90mP29_05660 [bacterium]
MGDSFVPWGKEIELGSDQEVSIAYELVWSMTSAGHGLGLILFGTWCMVDHTLKTQEGQWYDNGTLYFQPIGWSLT